MVEIFDYPTMPEMPFLRELADELEGTLHVIAHAGHATNTDYIKQQQEYFREKYGRFLEHVHSTVGQWHIISAYDTLQQLFWSDPDSDEIIRRCEECIHENLMGGPLPDDYFEAFEEFFQQNR
jgi:hypothetical protein